MQLKNIVFPVDFSDRSYTAAPFIQSMARRYVASVSLVHAIQPPPRAASLDARLREFANEQLRNIETHCTVLEGDPAAAIIAFAERTKADLIALPTHGYGLFRRAFLGSVTTKILHDSSLPVWTSAHCSEPSHRAHPQPRRIVAAIDLKDKTELTLQTALALARDAGASVEILHIADEGKSSSTFRERAVARAVASAAAYTSLLVEEREPLDLPMETHGESVESVISRMALLKRADLVVIGRGSVHGSMFDRICSHAYATICESPCPVLSV